ncbi:MAG TPA: HRDC domain-containing protein, partial [Steroidobacteraceae bacterium]|nr:HRDC domain-containing protein [Steroidobacteraceae bacterium]
DQILEYFEDVAEELGGCSQCDNCVAAAEGRLGEEPDAAASSGVVRDALSAIRGLPFAVGAGVLASYLLGHGSAQIRRYDWQARDKFGVLRDRSEGWLRRLLRRCVAGGLLAFDAEHATLRITKRGADVTAGVRENMVRLPPETRTRRIGAGVESGDLSGGELALFEALKAWRRLRADADGVPAYVICHDATLRSIAAARPASTEALLAVNGLGPAKVQRYGAQLLAELRDHGGAVPAEFRRDAPAEAHPEPDEDAGTGRRFSEHQLAVRRTHARAYERWSDEEDARVAALAGEGRTPDEIAAALERQPNAIAMRMEKLGLTPPSPAHA